MHYALLGDIHSSLEDLQAVCQQIAEVAPGALLIGTGDLYECTVSKKDLRGQIYSTVKEVMKHSVTLEECFTFPSVYGNQEERILLLTERAETLRDRLQQLPETLTLGEAIVIHGHQWQMDTRDAWLAEHLPEAPLLFHGHTHRSGCTCDGEVMEIPVDGLVKLTSRHIVNVGAVVESRQWVWYDADEHTVRFMQAKKG